MSHLIPTEFIQEVLTRSDIVEIIRSRVSLTQRGDNHVARCPFHEEKTPSFSVSHSKQFYYCFGCNASGNAIGFLMAFDHLEFREAVAYLAARVGLEMPAASDRNSTQPYQILHQVLESAAHYYQTALRAHPPAIQYLKSRGLSGVTAKHFGLGYAPAAWQELSRHFDNQPEKLAALTQSGMTVVKESQRSYDRFRDRIMFPIRNIQGQIIGFGGRTLGDAQPKYLNSPETPLFHKGDELYGLYEARQHSTQLTQLIVVEGYMDVIALHQQGITEAVATLGTAITAKQVQKCLRYVNHLIFCFDGDRAGRQAGWKALTIALPLLREGIHIRFLFLPPAEDPDSLVRKIGADAFSQLITQAAPLSEVFFRELKRQSPLDSPAGKAQFGQQAAQYLNGMPHGLFRQLMYEQLAKELAIDSTALNALLQPPSPPPATSSPAASKKLPGNHSHSRPTAMIPAHSLAIRALLQHPNIHQLDEEPLQSVEALLPVISTDADELIEDIKLLKLINQLRRNQPTITIGELLAQIEDEKKRHLVAELAARPVLVSADELQSEFSGALSHLVRQIDEHEIQMLVKKAKKSQLNFEEKGKLQALLAKLKRDASER